MEPVSAALMAAGPIVALIGRAVAEGDFERARQIRAQAAAEYGDSVLPVIDRVVAQEVGPSAMANIRTDDGLRSQQLRALDELSNIYESGGQTEADKAALNVAQNAVAARSANALANGQQRLARTGQTGNAALESSLAATVGGDAAGAMADMGYRAQADARDRALRALESEASLAGGVRAQDFGEASTKAKAADAFTLFNADQRSATQAANNANAFRQYDARMGLKAARNNARGVQAADYDARGARTVQTAAGLGNAATSMGGAFGNYKRQKPPEEE